MAKFGWTGCHPLREAVRRCALAFLLLWLLAGIVPAARAETPREEPSMEAAQPEDVSSFLQQVVRNLFNSRALMQTLGRPEFAIAAFVVLNVIVFTETGLLIGFFLPGDSLLVTAGLIASNPACAWHLPTLLFTLTAAAILGDSVGYSIGFKTGPKIFNREKSFFFHKDHLLKAQEFYEKHGGKTIVIARFMPILRTFAPIVAGVGKMRYAYFLTYNIVGGFSWVWSMILLGYFLPSAINPVLRPLFGDEFQVQDHIEKVIIVVVLASISPGIYVWLRSKLSQPALLPEEAAVAEAK